MINLRNQQRNQQGNHYFTTFVYFVTALTIFKLSWFSQNITFLKFKIILSYPTKLLVILYVFISPPTDFPSIFNMKGSIPFENYRPRASIKGKKIIVGSCQI